MAIKPPHNPSRKHSEGGNLGPPSRSAVARRENELARNLAASDVDWSAVMRTPDAELPGGVREGAAGPSNGTQWALDAAAAAEASPDQQTDADAVRAGARAAMPPSTLDLVLRNARTVIQAHQEADLAPDEPLSPVFQDLEDSLDQYEAEQALAMEQALAENPFHEQLGTRIVEDTGRGRGLAFRADPSMTTAAAAGAAVGPGTGTASPIGAVGPEADVAAFARPSTAEGIYARHPELRPAPEPTGGDQQGEAPAPGGGW